MAVAHFESIADCDLVEVDFVTTGGNQIFLAGDDERK